MNPKTFRESSRCSIRPELAIPFMDFFFLQINELNLGSAASGWGVERLVLDTGVQFQRHLLMRSRRQKLACS